MLNLSVALDTLKTVYWLVFLDITPSYLSVVSWVFFAGYPFSSLAPQNIALLQGPSLMGLIYWICTCSGGNSIYSCGLDNVYVLMASLLISSCLSSSLIGISELTYWAQNLGFHLASTLPPPFPPVFFISANASTTIPIHSVAQAKNPRFISTPLYLSDYAVQPYWQFLLALPPKNSSKLTLLPSLCLPILVTIVSCLFFISP